MSQNYRYFSLFENALDFLTSLPLTLLHDVGKRETPASAKGAKLIVSGLGEIIAILMLAYSGGLRVGEVVRLKPEDIHTNRKLIHVRASKGRKDRYTLLSDVALETLREYWKREKPKKWLFPSWNKEKHITGRTVQKIFRNACKKAGIMKNVSVHSLRHSFATHLLESGIDLRYIQELLGHKSSKTSEIYTHVSTKNFSAIKNPLDILLA